MNPSPNWCLRAVAGLILGATASIAQAAIWTWPAASGQCSTTLQACIDASANADTVQISTSVPVDENINLGNRSLTLTAAPGVKPRFADGRSLFGTASTNANVSVNVSRIGFTNGYVSLGYVGTGTGTYDIRALDIVRSGAGSPAYLRISAGSGSTVNANVFENRIHGTPTGLNAGLIDLAAGGGTLNAYVAWNTLSRSDNASGSGAGIFADMYASAGVPAAGYLRVFGNTIRGHFGRAAIYFSEGLFSSVASTFSALAFNNVVIGAGEFPRGIGFVANNGTIEAQAINNTLAAVHNGISALRWDGAGVDSRVNGYIWNNLIVASSSGLQFTSSLTPGLANNYNLINAPGNSATLGPNTISADARLVAAQAPRLRAGSPAINAADGTLLANALIDAGLPTLDADGLRRVKGPGADIGAYEYGDTSLLHIAAGGNISGHITRIDSPATNAQTGALVLPTRSYGPAGPRSLQPFGVYYEGSRWTIYHEAIAAISSGLQWGVFVPVPGSGAFVHSGTAANTTAARTQIDNAATNGYPERIVLVAHNWTAQPTYNAHLTGIYWSGSGVSGRWNIANTDQTALPIPNAFNVYAQQASPNAFRLPAPVGMQRAEIDHPLVNGVACATIHATRIVDPAASVPAGSFDLDFNFTNGRWAVYSPLAWVAGTAFNVLIDARQVFDCQDRIFANGFD